MWSNAESELEPDTYFINQVILDLGKMWPPQVGTDDPDDIAGFNLAAYYDNSTE